MWVFSPKASGLVVFQHRNLNPTSLCRLDCFSITGIHMAHNAGSGIIGQDARELFGGLNAAVRNDDHAGME